MTCRYCKLTTIDLRVSVNIFDNKFLFVSNNDYELQG